MATDLREMQFEILPHEHATSGVVFGIGANVSVNEDGFRPDSGEWLTQDADNPINGATSFGRDVQGAPTWSWDLHVNRDDTEGALESMEAFIAAWSGEGVSNQPGEVQVIRYRVGGRTRRVYGRPRRASGEPNNLILFGRVDMQAEFKLVHRLIYGDEFQSHELNAPVGTGGGGMVFPVTFPLDIDPPPANESSLYVQGSAPTYPIIEFSGPISNPVLETGDWRLALNVNLGPTDTLTVDARPWALSVMLNGSTPAGGTLARGQRLNDVRLRPGAQSISLSSNALAAGGRCRVRWVPAYYSL